MIGPEKTREQLLNELARMEEKVAVLEQRLNETDQNRHELERMQFHHEYLLGLTKAGGERKNVVWVKSGEG